MLGAKRGKLILLHQNLWSKCFLPHTMPSFAKPSRRAFLLPSLAQYDQIYLNKAVKMLRPFEFLASYNSMGTVVCCYKLKYSNLKLKYFHTHTMPSFAIQMSFLAFSMIKWIWPKVKKLRPFEFLAAYNNIGTVASCYIRTETF